MGSLNLHDSGLCQRLVILPRKRKGMNFDVVVLKKEKSFRSFSLIVWQIKMVLSATCFTKYVER